LIQYTLAADRTNEAVASLYSAGDPAVIRLIEQVIKAAAKYNIDVNVCGEMSGEPIYTMLLLGLGATLSVTPHNIPEIRRLSLRLPSRVCPDRPGSLAYGDGARRE